MPPHRKEGEDVRQGGGKEPGGGSPKKHESEKQLNLRENKIQVYGVSRIDERKQSKRGIALD